MNNLVYGNSSSSAGLLSSSGRIPSYGCSSAGSSPRSSNDWAPYRAQDSPRIGKKSVIGKERIPMLIIDSDPKESINTKINARKAAIFGFGSPVIIYFILYLIKPSQY